MTHDNLPPWAEDMQAIFQEAEDKIENEELKQEFEALTAEISSHMLRVDNAMDRMNEILQELLGPRYFEEQA